MPASIVEETMQQVEPLREDATVRDAVERILGSELPALPVVDAEGSFAGIFGEREFMGALFPGYMKELSSSAMIKRTIDETIEKRTGCMAEPLSDHLTRDHVSVSEDTSDAHLAELFLHHRVMIIPVTRDEKVVAIVRRSDFFRALARRALA